MRLRVALERINNTMRADLAALARKAQALARSPLHLQQLLLTWLAYYHLTCPPASLRLPKSKQPIAKLRDRTPARAQPPCGMAAGVVDAVWSFLRFLRTRRFLHSSTPPTSCTWLVNFSSARLVVLSIEMLLSQYLLPCTVN